MWQNIAAKNPPKPDYFSELPDEILLFIFGYLTPRALNQVALMNKRFLELSRDPYTKMQANSLYYFLQNEKPNQFRRLKTIFAKHYSTTGKLKEILIDDIHYHNEEYRQHFSSLKIVKNNTFLIDNHRRENCMPDLSKNLLKLFFICPGIAIALSFIGLFVAKGLELLNLPFKMLVYLVFTLYGAGLGLPVIGLGYVMLYVVNCCLLGCLPDKKVKIPLDIESLQDKHWERFFSTKKETLNLHQNGFFNCPDLEAASSENIPLMSLSGNTSQCFSEEKSMSSYGYNGRKYGV